MSYSPLYIETKFAWYILRKPSAAYRETFNTFYVSRRVTQIAISAALNDQQYTYERFKTDFISVYDEFLGKRLDDKMVEAAVRFTLWSCSGQL